MDINYEDVIDCSGIKKVLDERGMKAKFLAEKVGQPANRLSQIIRNNNFPKTDLIARICAVLKVPVSEVVDFKIERDEKKEKWFSDKILPYSPPEHAEGELTYEPLRLMMNMYLDYINGLKDTDKTVDDLFDKIEPYRRRNGLVSPCGIEAIKKSLVARGYDENYKSERTDRKYKAKGLTPAMRLKIKKDRPLNLRSLYDICNFFGCSVDWVMSYK